MIPLSRGINNSDSRRAIVSLSLIRNPMDHIHALVAMHKEGLESEATPLDYLEGLSSWIPWHYGSGLSSVNQHSSLDTM